MESLTYQKWMSNLTLIPNKCCFPQRDVSTPLCRSIHEHVIHAYHEAKKSLPWLYLMLFAHELGKYRIFSSHCLLKFPCFMIIIGLTFCICKGFSISKILLYPWMNSVPGQLYFKDSEYGFDPVLSCSLSHVESSGWFFFLLLNLNIFLLVHVCSTHYL